MITNSRALRVWAHTEVRIWPGEYLLIHVPLAWAAQAAALVGAAEGFAAWVRERDEVALTLPQSAWSGQEPWAVAARVARGWRVLTLEADVDLDVCGYLAPAAIRLAEAGVPIVPQCGFLKDHLLVPAERLDDAMAVLEGLIRGARVTTAE